MTVNVVQPTAKPVSDFIVDQNVIQQGKTVSFFDLSSNGPSSWKWTISPATTLDQGSQVPTYKIIYGSLTTSKMTVRFLYPGKYTVCLTASNAKGTGNTECKTNYIEVTPVLLMGSTSLVNSPSGT